MYTTDWCPYCRRAEALLAARGVTAIEHINVDRLADGRRVMMQRTGRRTVPQIFVGERHIGGFDELAAADRRGDLKVWLAECATMTTSGA
jgi:glutaredoxin 3